MMRALLAADNQRRQQLMDDNQVQQQSKDDNQVRRQNNNNNEKPSQPTEVEARSVDRPEARLPEIRVINIGPVSYTHLTLPTNREV